MRRLLQSLPALLLVLGACGDEFGDSSQIGGGLRADPRYFQAQRFDCDASTATPSCPPYTCAVDETGRIFDCVEDRCAFDNDSTAFEYRGAVGHDLCVPPMCSIPGENLPPVCEPGCAEDDITIYVFQFVCR